MRGQKLKITGTGQKLRLQMGGGDEDPQVVDGLRRLKATLLAS